jgi:hypothetical protein
LDAIMEMFCAAPHGMVTHYEESHDSIIPVLREEHNVPAMSWGLETCHEAIWQFAELLPLDQGFLVDACVLRPVVCALLEGFWHSPTSEEALVWGDFRIESDQVSSYSVPLARPVTLAELIKGSSTGHVRIGRHRWPAASMLRTPRALRHFIRLRKRAADWRLGAAKALRSLRLPFGK